MIIPFGITFALLSNQWNCLFHHYRIVTHSISSHLYSKSNSTVFSRSSLASYLRRESYTSGMFSLQRSTGIDGSSFLVQRFSSSFVFPLWNRSFSSRDKSNQSSQSVVFFVARLSHLIIKTSDTNSSSVVLDDLLCKFFNYFLSSRLLVDISDLHRTCLRDHLQQWTMGEHDPYRPSVDSPDLLHRFPH